MSDTLLSYAASSNPDPIQASPQTGDPSLATLTIVVSNDTHKQINCSSISFGFRQGKYAKDFFTDSTGIATSAPEGWSLLPDQADPSLFKATPSKDASRIGPDGVVFVLSNIKVNQQVGTTDMTVTEVTTNGSGNTGTLALPLAKFPPQFEVGELQVSPPPPLAPGSSVTLIWSGSDDGATYVLQYEDADGNTVTITHVKGEPNQPLPSTGDYTIDNLQKDTTFYLIVTVNVPGQNKPLTVERYFPVTVKQLKPQITLFEGKVECISSSWQLVLNWQTNNTDYCTITGDAHQLTPSSTNDSYKIPLTPYSSNSAGYTLTAKSGMAQDTSQITLEWQFKQTGSIGTGGLVYGIACSPDGTRIYVTNFLDDYPYGSLVVFDAKTLQQIGEPIQVGNMASGVAVSPDGTRLYVISWYDSNLWVLNAKTLQQIGNPIPLVSAAGNQGFMAIAASPDGGRIYVISQNNETVPFMVFDAESLQQIGSPIMMPGTLGNVPISISVSRDSKRIYVISGGAKASIVCLDAGTLQPIGAPTWVGSSQVGGVLAVSADGTRIYFGNTNDWTLWTLDATYLQPIGGTVRINEPWFVAVSPLSPHVYVASQYGATSVFSIANVSGGKVSASMPDEEAALHRAMPLSREGH